MRLRFLLCLSLTFLLPAACAPSAPASPTVDVPAIYTAAIRTISFQLTETARPTATATGTPTLTPSPTLPATATSTPGADFGRISLAGVGPGPNDLNMLIFDLPGLSLDPGQYRLIANGVPGTCGRNAANPDKLYCSVDFPNEALLLSIQILPVGSDQVLYSFTLQATSTPNYPTPPPLSYYQGSANCDVEPLWVPPLSGPYGCYAITCQRYDGSGTCGTRSTCDSMPVQPCP